MSLRDNTERHLFYKDIYKHRGYAYYAFAIWWSMGGRTIGIRPPPKVLSDSVKRTSVVEWSKFS